MSMIDLLWLLPEQGAIAGAPRTEIIFADHCPRKALFCAMLKHGTIATRPTRYRQRRQLGDISRPNAGEFIRR
jgi:hypothetical protein